MIDIQSATAEIKRGKKEERRKIETTGQKYNACPLFHRVAMISTILPVLFNHSPTVIIAPL